MVKHPAKYNDKFIPIFADILKDKERVLDPFAGVGKIGLIKNFGFNGEIYANDIESDWVEPNEFKCDHVTVEDSEFLNYEDEFFDAICTSPTYGNRMADHHNAKDGSKRNTYTHCIGHDLEDGNTGKMQWGIEYREKHERIYKNLCRMLKRGGIFVLNIKNFIKKGEEVDVTQFHIDVLGKYGLEVEGCIKVPVNSNGFGANGKIRVDHEWIIILKKIDNC